LIVLVVALTTVLALMIAATWSGLTCCTPAGVDRPALGVLVSLALSLAAVMACFGGIAVALSAVARRRAAAAGISGAIAFAAYLLDYLGRAWQPAHAISVVSPFHYFEPMAIVIGGSMSSGNIGVLLAIAAIGAAFGMAAFSRRDM
jgi:ABC-type transport system involved in multi-copper enzyme maturation permease subunit